MPDSVALTRAKPEDLSAIARLAQLVWRHHYPGIISPAQIDYMLARMYDLAVLRQELADGVAYHCLSSGGELAGFSSHSPAGTEMKLHKLYVHPEHQRKGFGSLLLQAVEQDAAARGFGTLILAVNKANHQAIAAYRKHGFTVRDSVVVEIGNGFVMDDYVMAKKVAALSRDAATNV